MRQVRNCDFCGDDAAGVYEPLPPSVPDAPRMILCDACRDRLSSVVDPLLAELGVDQAGDSGGRAARATGDPGDEAATSEADGGSSADRTTADGPAADLESRDWPADPAETADGASDRPVETADRTADGPAGGADAPEPAAEDVPDEPASPPSSVDDMAGGGDGDGNGGVEVSESRDASGRTQRERGGAPRGYRKVLRFLENRQLPVDRSEAERLAAEAYEFDAAEVSAAIDHAIQYGRLREVSGELRR